MISYSTPKLVIIVTYFGCGGKQIETVLNDIIIYVCMVCMKVSSLSLCLCFYIFELCMRRLPCYRCKS